MAQLSSWKDSSLVAWEQQQQLNQPGWAAWYLKNYDFLLTEYFKRKRAYLEEQLRVKPDNADRQAELREIDQYRGLRFEFAHDAKKGVWNWTAALYLFYPQEMTFRASGETKKIAENNASLLAVWYLRTQRES